jgi:hypothetical protein
MLTTVWVVLNGKYSLEGKKINLKKILDITIAQQIAI